MKTIRRVAGLVGVLVVAVRVWGAAAPEEVRAGAWEGAVAAWEAVDALATGQVEDEAAFVMALRTIVQRDALTAAERADVLALMLRRAGMGFNGAVALPPWKGYVDVFAAKVARLERCRAAMAGAKVDVAWLVDTVKREHGRDSVRSGAALLLAAMCDAQAARPVVEALLNPARLKAAQVPPITVHSVALAVVILGDDALTQAMVVLASQIPLEECQEDLICAAASRPMSPRTQQMVIDFVRASALADFNTAGQSGLILLRRRLEAAAFDALLTDLIGAAVDESRRAALETCRRSEPPRGGMGEPPDTPPGQSRPLFKKWDGFSVTVYDDGALIQWGDRFRDFVSY